MNIFIKIFADNQPYPMGVGEQKAEEKGEPSALLSCTLKIVLVYLVCWKSQEYLRMFGTQSKIYQYGREKLLEVG